MRVIGKAVCIIVPPMGIRAALITMHLPSTRTHTGTLGSHTQHPLTMPFLLHMWGLEAHLAELHT